MALSSPPIGRPKRSASKRAWPVSRRNGSVRRGCCAGRITMPIASFRGGCFRFWRNTPRRWCPTRLTRGFWICPRWTPTSGATPRRRIMCRASGGGFRAKSGCRSRPGWRIPPNWPSWRRMRPNRPVFWRCPPGRNASFYKTVRWGNCAASPKTGGARKTMKKIFVAGLSYKTAPVEVR